MPSSDLWLGPHRYDVTCRALVVGILNRTVDSFYDRGAYFRLDDLLSHADRLVSDGADVLEVGARAAGVGTRDVSEDEELELVASTLCELRRRFDVPLAVDTWRASVARAAFDEGAVLANDMSGFSDAGYLSAAAAVGASVVATHIRLAPRVADPNPHYDDVVTDVCEALLLLAKRAESARIPPQRIIVDPGLDLGKTCQQSLRLLAATCKFASLGYPMMLAVSNKIFLGRLLGLRKQERQHATLAACTTGVERGARLLRVHEVLPVRQAVDLLAAIYEAT